MILGLSIFLRKDFRKYRFLHFKDVQTEAQTLHKEPSQDKAGYYICDMLKIKMLVSFFFDLKTKFQLVPFCFVVLSTVALNGGRPCP